MTHTKASMREAPPARAHSFIHILLRALDQVAPEYFKVSEIQARDQDNLLAQATREQANVARAISRHSERVFCYELYHQLRLALNGHPFAEEHLFKSVFLQAELIKPRRAWLNEVADHIAALKATYIPDFLIHEPGTFDHQLVIMEVKSAPNATLRTLTADLLKLDQFVSRYQYREAIMLVVNCSADRAAKVLSQPSAVRWLEGNIKHHDVIRIVAKESPQADPWHKTIAELLAPGG